MVGGADVVRKRIEGCKPDEEFDRWQGYSREDIEKILAAVPVQISWRSKLRLWKELEFHARIFLVMRRLQAERAPPKRSPCGCLRSAVSTASPCPTLPGFSRPREK